MYIQHSTAYVVSRKKEKKRKKTIIDYQSQYSILLNVKILLYYCLVL